MAVYRSLFYLFLRANFPYNLLIMSIQNHITHRYIESNLVYPSHLEYKRVCKLDKDFVTEQLNLEFEVERINNKYAIQMSNGQIWYQHDGSTWVIEKI